MNKLDTVEKFDIVIDGNADFVLTLTIRDEDGNLKDLTGCTATAQLRESPESNDYFDFVCTHNDEGGKILITMSHSETEKIPYTHGVYDVLLETPTEILKLIYGEAEIIPHVTRNHV